MRMQVRNLKKVITALLIFTVLFSLTAVAEEHAIGLNDVKEWFGETIEDVSKKIEECGYKAEPDNKTSIMRDVAWEFTNEKLAPYSVVAWFNSEGRDVTQFVLKYHKDANLFNQMRQSFTLLFGEPIHQEFSDVTKDGHRTIVPETISWDEKGYIYRIGFSSRPDGSRGSLKDTENGEAGFSVVITQHEEESESSEETAQPSATPRPTATPRPVKVEVDLHSVEIKDSRYGSSRQFYIRFKNNASSTVDRIDFLIKGYNRYGERIVQYNADTFEFYIDEEIKPGKVSPANIYFYQSALDEATKIKIAIQKYHTADGRTVTVPDYQLSWTTYEK